MKRNTSDVFSNSKAACTGTFMDPLILVFCTANLYQLRLLPGLFNAHHQVLDEWGVGAKALTNSFCDAAIGMAVVQNISCPR